MLKEKISAGATKTRRYEEKELHYHRTLCLQRTRNSLTRNFMVVVAFQIKPLILKKLLNFGAKFGPYLTILTKMLQAPPKVKEKLKEIEQQEDIRISVDNAKMATRRMTNRKGRGVACFQRYCFKKFSTFHSRLTEHLQNCAAVDDVPTWMTKRKTILIQKDPEKEKLPTTIILSHVYHLCRSC